MSDFFVRSKNIDKLIEYGKITYKAKFMDLVVLETNLSMDEVENIDGVYSVEIIDVFGKLEEIRGR